MTDSTEREELAFLIEDSSGVSAVMADLVAGEILARYRLEPVECGNKQSWERHGRAGWHLCTLPIGHDGDHYCNEDFKTWPAGEGI